MWIVLWNPFLMKTLLKSEVCGSVSSTRMHYSWKTWLTTAVRERKKKSWKHIRDKLYPNQALNNGKRQVQVENTYFESKFMKKMCVYIYIYRDLKLIITKILSIVFIVVTLILSHINIAFRFTSVRLNLNKFFLNMKAMHIQM